MDIKILLLKSLSSQKPITGTRRIYFGKSCKRKTWIHRIRQRRNLQETIKNKTFEDKETLTSTRDSLKSKEIQTEIIIKPPVPTKSIGLQSELVNLSSASQQTLHSTSRFLVRKGNKSQIPTLKSLSRFCQTLLITQASIGIQCSVGTQERAINTEDFLRNSYAQVESDLFLTTGGVASSNTGNDFEVLIYMLNEIGDIVINQNQLLNNNREMLNHILQLNLLRRVKSSEIATRSTSIQTDEPPNIKTRNIFCQTSPKFTKPRKLSFLTKRTSNHK